MDHRPSLAEFDKLKTRIQALRACTEDEALSAAAKVAELLDRYDLSLTDVEMTAASAPWRISATAEFGARRTRRARPATSSSAALGHRRRALLVRAATFPD